MYGRIFDVEEEKLDKDYLIPIGKAKVEQEGIQQDSVPYAC